MKKIFSLLITTIIFFTVTFYIQAADYTITCNGSSCSDTLSAFFTTSDIWYPGMSKSKTVQVFNNSSEPMYVGVQSSNESTTGNLDQVIHFTITRSDSSTAYSNNLANFYGLSDTELASSLASGSNDTYSFNAQMYTSAGNEYQAKNTEFDLVFTLTGLSAPVGKTTSLSLSCTNSNFDAIVELKDNDAPKANVKVNFTYQGQNHDATTDSDGKARVGFNLDGEDKQVQAVPEDGFPSQSASINSKSCSESVTSTSTTTTTTTAGGVLGLITNIFSPFTGETGEALGETTEEAKITPTTIPGLTPSVQGVNTGCRCIWWPIILGEFFVLLVFYVFFLKKYQGKLPKTFYLGVFIPILTHVIFLWINRQCFGGFRFILFPSSNSFFCRYFLIVNTFVYALTSIAWRKLFKEEKILVGKDEKN